MGAFDILTCRGGSCAAGDRDEVGVEFAVRCTSLGHVPRGGGVVLFASADRTSIDHGETHLGYKVELNHVTWLRHYGRRDEGEGIVGAYGDLPSCRVRERGEKYFHKERSGEMHLCVLERMLERSAQRKGTN